MSSSEHSSRTDRDGTRSRIYQKADGRWAAAVYRPYSGWEPVVRYQQAHTYAAREEAERAVAERLAGFDAEYQEYTASGFSEAVEQGIGARWRGVSFWGPDPLWTVVYQSSTHGSPWLVCEDGDGVMHLVHGPGVAEQIRATRETLPAWLRRYRSAPVVSASCVYCGLPASGAGPLGDPACEACGGI